MTYHDTYHEKNYKQISTILSLIAALLIHKNTNMFSNIILQTLHVNVSRTGPPDYIIVWWRFP